MSDLFEKAASYTEAKNLIGKGDCLIAGISGGADSVCLLFLLCGLRERLGIEIRVVHVNHGIRREADEDARFVEKLCERLGVSCRVVKKDVPALAENWGMSEEEAGRRVRYEAFYAEAEQAGKEKGLADERIKIAVAHNMNDNAETVLFRMFRGSGIKGLAGIPALREGRYAIVRPLLFAGREEIEEYLRSRNEGWVNDCTNELDIYARNRIRHNILPEAERVASGAVKHINEVAGIMAETEDLLSALTGECFDRCVEVTGKGNNIPVKIDIKEFSKLHIALKKRVVHRCLKEVSGGGRDLGALQVEQILELAEREGNRSIDIARGIAAVREYGFVTIRTKMGTGESESKENPEGQKQGISNKTDGRSCDEDNPVKGRIKIERYALSELVSKDKDFLRKLGDEANVNKYTKWLDCDKIDGHIEMRKRCSGDYFMISRPGGGFGKKSLKAYLIDCKVPAAARDNIPVVACKDKCLWLVGYRISDDIKVTEETKEVYKVTYEKES